MQRSSIVARFHAVPLHHWIFAAVISVATIAASFAPALHTSGRFESSAILSFDGTGYEQSVQPGKQPGGESAEDLARSILHDDALQASTTHAGSTSVLFSNGKVRQHPASLTLTGISPSQLRATWQGDSPDETIAAANEVTRLLTSWVPADNGSSQQQPVIALPPLGPPAAIESKPPVVTTQRDTTREPADHETSLKQQTELLMQIDDTDHRLAGLTAEQGRREQSLQQSKAEMQRQLAARQPLETELAAAKQKLENLRVRYTDDYPAVETAQEKLSGIESRLAALPPVRQISAADQTGIDAIAKQIGTVRAERGQLLQSLIDLQTKSKSLPIQPPGREQSAKRAMRAQTAIASQPLQEGPRPQVGLKTEEAETPPKASVALRSPFGIVEPARVAVRIDTMQSSPKWPGIALGASLGIFYLAVALWWFRPIQRVAALEQFLTPEVAFVGSIPRMIR
jgi:hypothetical protein